MEIKIITKDVHLGKEREEKIRKKFEKLENFASRIGDEATEIRVELCHEESKRAEDAYLCILNIFAPQETLRAECRSDALETAIDGVFEKIKKPIERYKEKTQHISEKK